MASTASELITVTAYGATGDGGTDDTAAIQAALAAAGTSGTGVWFPPAAGGCYRTTGVSVPAGVTGLYGSAVLSRAGGPGVTALAGSVLAPASGAVTSLLTVGSSGSGTFVSANPHGLVVDGLGFLGLTAAGPSVPGMWGVTVTDTSDVTLIRCRDLYCDAPDFTGYPTGPAGAGQGGFAQFLSSGSGNGFAENARVLYCGSYGAGRFLKADGTVPKAGGSTDGRVVSCQVNGHSYGIQLGPSQAGAGGWAILECHFSSTDGTSHIDYGSAGMPWTLRVEACYLDVCQGTPLICNGRGLIATGNYVRAGTTGSNTLAISFGAGLATRGRDPAAVVQANTFDLNASTSVQALAQFNGFTAADFALIGGGEYRSNVVHNHGAVMPASWAGQWIGSDGLAVANTTTSTLDLAAGPVLSE
jgi:Pectate lyase superfamily protein